MSVLRANTELEGNLFSKKDDPKHALENVESEISDYSYNGLKVERNKFLEENKLGEDYIFSQIDNEIIQNRCDENLNHLNQRKAHIEGQLPVQEKHLTFAERENARQKTQTITRD